MYLQARLNSAISNVFAIDFYLLSLHRFVTISELACVCSKRDCPMQDSCKCNHVQKAGAPSEGVPHGLVSGNQVSRPPPYIPLRRVVAVCEQKVHLEAASPAHCCPKLRERICN